MTRNAVHASSGRFLEAYDFDQNYMYLKKLIQELKAENGVSLKKEIFGEEDSNRTLTKKQMKQLFKFLRKIESHYEECCNPPIPEELELSIRNRDRSRWLPWEEEAIDKVEAWRSELDEKRMSAKGMFESALEKVYRGEFL